MVLLLLVKRRSIGGSLIGGIAETPELLDFCAEHNIVSDVEMISISEIETAFERMIKSAVKISIPDRHGIVEAGRLTLPCGGAGFMSYGDSVQVEAERTNSPPQPRMS